MNIVNKLTLRHLRENKGRSIVTTLGICVSVAMITAVFVAVASFLNLFGEITVIADGDWHAKFYDISQEQLADIYSDGDISEVGIYIEDKEKSSVCLENRKNDGSGIQGVLIGDEAYLSQMLTSDLEGALPKNENEVAVEQSFIDNNGLAVKIGDKISLSEGCKYIVEDGEKAVFISDYHYPGEKFSGGKYKEYTVTGILHDNPATRFTPVFRGMSDGEKSGTVSAAVKLADVNYKSLRLLNDKVKKYNISDYKLNTDYLETFFAVDENSTIAVSILPMAAVILLIIMIASVVLVYNAFAMSLSERVRYLGMLASVGATRKQKRLSVYCEGLVLGCIGIPVGIGAGIAGIAVTLSAVGDKIISSGMILGVSDSNMQMKTVVPLWAIVGIVIVSALTIFISCFVPSRRASKTTPIDAIRQTDTVKLKAKKLKSPRIVRRIFGYEGELAYKNLKRNAGRSRVITASIAMSIILFLSCNYFCTMMTLANSYDAAIPYQLAVRASYSESEELKAELDKLPDVDRYYTVNNMYFRCGGDNPSLEDNIENEKYLTAPYKKLFTSATSLYICVIDDDAFNELCTDNGIDYNAFYSDTVSCVLLNDITRSSSGRDVFNEGIIGQHIKTTQTATVVDIPVDFEIAGLVGYDSDNYVCTLTPKGNIAAYIPLSQYTDVYCAGMSADEINIIFGVETDKHSEIAEKIEKISESGALSLYVNDYVDVLQVTNALVFVIKVFIYGFISLITLITLANIINTISTNILLRRKEFAMLKSIGITPSGFRKMISLESLLYGLKAVIIGVPAGLLISYVLNEIMSSHVIAFTIDWALYAVVIAVVFAVIGLTMLYAVTRLKNDNVAETLKEEIN